MVRTEEMETISSCDEGQEEDRCTQVPTAEAIGIQEIEPVPLGEVYLQKNIWKREETIMSSCNLSVQA